ncbi:MAG: LemA family protein [bacterium]|nr:LemA family protein [bacterium]
MPVALIIILVVVVLLVIFCIASYNKLVNGRNKVKDQWSQIDVQLKRRTDLIPNLVETVKGYAKHEETTFTEVIEARNKVVSANSINEEIDANNALSGALSKLFAVAESYPDLKANQNFMSLQNDLRDTEDKISSARQFYNDTVLTYNNMIEMFPSNIVASIFGFKAFEFFKVDEKELANPQVKF